MILQPIARKAGLLAAAAALSAATPAPPAAPLVASGKWVVDYHPNLCVAMRAFGTGADRVDLGLRPLPMSDRLEMVMVTPDKPVPAHRGDAAIALGPAGKPVTGDYIAWTVPKTRDRIMVMSFGTSATEHLGEATTLAVTIDRKPAVTVALQNTPAVLKALKACTDDLLRTWGIDPAESDRIATLAQGASPADWFSTNDYPAGAGSGEVTILWTIAADGRVRECRVVAQSGDPRLDKASCDAVVRRARYKPAIGLDGKPMPSHITRHIIWRMPE